MRTLLLLIIILLLSSCSGVDYQESKDNMLDGVWRQFTPKGDFFLGGLRYEYTFVRDSFYVKEFFLMDSRPNYADISLGSGMYKIFNNKIVLYGYYSKTYDMKYYRYTDSGEVRIDSVYNVKSINERIKENYSFCVNGDTLILN